MSELSDRTVKAPPCRDEARDSRELLNSLHELGLGRDSGLERLLDRATAR